MIYRDMDEKTNIETEQFEDKIWVTLFLFHWKTFYKDSFSHFLVFGSTKKTWSMENYLWSTENSNKNKAYFL